jgi:hypothetical protein
MLRTWVATVFTLVASTSAMAALPRPIAINRNILIERNVAEEVMVDEAVAAGTKQVNDEIGIEWLYSFLSANKRKAYCLYEAPNADAIRTAARRLNIPADVIIPVSEPRPAQFAAQPAAAG